MQEENNCNKPTDPSSSLPLLLKADHIPTNIGKSGSELIACQVCSYFILFNHKLTIVANVCDIN